MHFTLSVVDARGAMRARFEGEDFVQLDRYNEPYCTGDSIVLEADQDEVELEVMLDAGLLPAIVLLKGGHFELPVPFDKAARAYAPGAFGGNRIWGYARAIDARERLNWRNLAQNSHDVDGQQVLFPHASTNSGATDERFMARNAIDGVTQTCLHGAWPYSSWGTNKRDDAWLQIDFGRTVVAHELRLFLRADFPHDSWWKQATVTLSDGTSRIINVERTGQPQSFSLDASHIEWLRLENLVRGDESPFPALSQLQVWGVVQ